jgi:glycosyltransferase involved in cell wall biosynthesis
MKNKQICFILSSSNIQNNRVRNDLYDFLTKKFDDVFFVGDFKDNCDKNQIIWSGAYNRSGLFFEVIILIRLIKLFFKYNPTHVISFAPKNNIYCGFLQPYFNYKLASVISGLGSYSEKFENSKSILNRFLKKSLENSTAIIAMNENNYNFLNKNFKSNKIFKIPSEGLNTTTVFNKISNPGSFLYLSRIIREKGIFLIIAAFKRAFLIYPALKLEIAGELSLNNNDKDLFFKEIKHVGIKYHGEVSEIKKTSLLISTSTVLLPSSYGEGLPMILLEAQLYNSLVITTRTTGCIDAISNLMSQFCCNYNEDSILEQMLNTIILSKDEKNLIIKESNSWVVSNHDNLAINNIYNKIFSDINFYN